MREQKTICYANTMDYGFDLQQRPHHIFNTLSKRGDWKIYWVNNFGEQAKFYSGQTKRRIKINDNLIIYNTWPKFVSDVKKVDVYFSAWAQRYRDIERAKDEPKNYILNDSGDMFQKSILDKANNGIKCKIVAYDSLDNFEAWEKYEKTMLKYSDVVFTTSQPLYDIRVNQHNNVHMCRNACYYEEFTNKEYKKPKVLEDLKSPIILFAGALANWCDLKLINRIAEKYTLVIVGREWDRKLPDNVHYFGCKPHDELQAFYAHCDVNILPFRRCQVGDYSNPIKNYEGMPHGKITVATDIPEAMIYPNVVLPSKNHDEFMSNIKKAIKMSREKDITELCKKTAQENTWNGRVDVIERELNKLLDEKGEVDE